MAQDIPATTPAQALGDYSKVKKSANCER